MDFSEIVAMAIRTRGSDELPHPGDMIFMSNVVHREDEETNATLMRKRLRALAPGGTLILKDHIMNEDHTDPRAGAIFALYPYDERTRLQF